jgi:hypothetical protein
LRADNNFYCVYRTLWIASIYHFLHVWTIFPFLQSRGWKFLNPSKNVKFKNSLHVAHPWNVRWELARKKFKCASRDFTLFFIMILLCWYKLRSHRIQRDYNEPDEHNNSLWARILLSCKSIIMHIHNGNAMHITVASTLEYEKTLIWCPSIKCSIQSY